MTLLDDLERELVSLRERGLHRSLREPSGIDFVSNDYLGLSSSNELSRAVATGLPGTNVGAPASRLLRGHTTTHRELETRFARFKGTEAALLFSSGYQANIGVLSTLIQRRDRVLADELNHASLIDGVRLTHPTKVIYPHLDVTAVERALQTPHRAGRTFIVTESLYSMDGDIAPLNAYADLAERHDAYLIIDDAHATGLYGPERGSGLVEEMEVAHRATAIVSTFGKALGLAGACVAGPATVIEYLVNKSRPFIFTTAQPPLLLHAIDRALSLLEKQPERRARVHQLAERLRQRLREHDVAGGGQGPIVPIIIGDSESAVRVAASIQLAGYDVRAVRPPTVPDGTSRLRISVHANHTEAEIDGLADAVATGVKTIICATA